jgi:hypothetical protein
MTVLSSLDRKDRLMMFTVVGLILILMVVLAVFTPSDDPAKNPVPGSYFTGPHGAKAAYTLLEQSGYAITRWEEPLSLLAAKADESTVLVLAEPYSDEDENDQAIATIVEKGGHVLATGRRGGLILPDNSVEESREKLAFAACEAQPEGLRPLADSGTVWIIPSSGWKLGNPAYRTDYTCGGHPVVVEYSHGKGSIVWWASSTPLENSSITRGQNMELLFNSVGPVQSDGKVRHIYWDESLHGESHSPWDYTSGPVWPLLLCGVIGLAILVVMSYSRRSGPVRELPQVPRTTPIEFLDALGSLYRSAGATAAAIQITWDRFRSQAATMSGQRNLKMDARELAKALERRFGAVANGMEEDLVAAEEACWNDALKPREALALVQKLHRHEAALRVASSARIGVTARV